MEAKKQRRNSKLANRLNSTRVFFSLSYKIKILLILCFALMGIVRLIIIFIPFRFIASRIGEKMSESPPEVDGNAQAKAAKIGWAISKMSRITPWESKCLVQALTAQIILKFLNIPYTLYLGLDRDESSKLIAHAWLRCGNLVVTGGREKHRFVTVMQFAGSSKNT